MHTIGMHYPAWLKLHECRMPHTLAYPKLYLQTFRIPLRIIQVGIFVFFLKHYQTIEAKFSKFHCFLLSGILQEDPTRPIDIELGSMDFASFQMLSDASVAMIGDQNIEEHLRQDFN